MPDYTVTDPTTGRTIKLTGDSPPTEAELEQIFSQYNPGVDRARPEPTESAFPWGTAAAALAAGAGAYALTRNSGSVGKAMSAVNDVRRASMLSGMAPVKSFLGNLGGTAYEAIERGSLAPLRELLSPQTAQDAVQLIKQGPNQALAGPATNLSKYNPFGRVMGALDQATQNALIRAGHTPAEAAKATLQAPVIPPWDTSNPVAGYMVPFYRTAANQLGEGLEALDPRLMTKGRAAANAVSAGTGFVEGRNAEDPKTLALGTAATGRYGLTHMAGQAAGRLSVGGSKRSAADAFRGIGPVSDYGISEGIIGPLTNPLDPKSIVPAPAALSAIDYLKSLFGLK